MAQPMNTRTGESLGKKQKSRPFTYGEQRQGWRPAVLERCEDGERQGMAGNPGGSQPHSEAASRIGGVSSPACRGALSPGQRGRDPRHTLGLAKEWGGARNGESGKCRRLSPAVHKSLFKIELMFESKNNVFFT